MGHRNREWSVSVIGWGWCYGKRRSDGNSVGVSGDRHWNWSIEICPMVVVLRHAGHEV